MTAAAAAASVKNFLYMQMIHSPYSDVSECGEYLFEDGSELDN